MAIFAVLQVIELTADMKTLEDNVENIKSSGNQASDNTSGDFIASSLRTDVAGECLLYH